MILQSEVRPHVCVLMSTYNGEQFLAEQLDSLLAQQGVDVTIVIRDDGSSDGTRKLLELYESRNRNIEVHLGSNLGVVLSFFDLMRIASTSAADFFALCDQDDVWLPEKLSKAVRALGPSQSIPRLYCSAVRYVDRSLRHISVSRTRLRPGFGNAVVENIATGCTTVFNKALLQRVNSAPPTGALMHDWWLYMVATAFGEVVFDPESWILYRQHGRNVIGGTTSMTKMLMIRLRRLTVRQDGIFKCSDQAREFLDCFGGRCPPAHREVLQEMLAVRGDFFERLRFAFTGKVRRNHWVDDGILRLLLIAGRY